MMSTVPIHKTWTTLGFQVFQPFGTHKLGYPLHWPCVWTCLHHTFLNCLLPLCYNLSSKSVWETVDNAKACATKVQPKTMLMKSTMVLTLFCPYDWPQSWIPLPWQSVTVVDFQHCCRWHAFPLPFLSTLIAWCCCDITNVHPSTQPHWYSIIFESFPLSSWFI